METRNLKGREPKTVVAVAEAKLVLVTYVNDDGREITQPAMVGKNNAVLLNAPDFGFGKIATPVGVARPWLTDGIRKLLEVEETKEKSAKEKAAKKETAKKESEK